MDVLKNFVKSRKLALSLFSLAVFSLLLVPRVFAQNAQPGLDLTVSPPVYDLTANPGDTVKQTFRIRNNGTSPLELQVTARRLISSPDNGSPVPESDTKGEELSWVTFNPSSFTAAPREWTNINYAINIPKTAAYGYYYVFGITEKNAQTQKTTGAAVKGEVLVVVLLNVKKEGAVSRADLVNFAPKSFVSEYLPVTFEVTVANKGNVHVKPHGNIYITRGEGKDIAILDVNPGVGSVLPGGKRTFETSWNDGFIVRQPSLDENSQPKVDKNGNPETHLAINWNSLTSFRIGPYTAHMLLVYDDGTRDQTIEGTTTFWVIPYTPIVVILVGLLVVYIVIRTLLRSYVRSQIKKGSGK